MQVQALLRPQEERSNRFFPRFFHILSRYYPEKRIKHRKHIFPLLCLAKNTKIHKFSPAFVEKICAYNFFLLTLRRFFDNHNEL